MPRPRNVEPSVRLYCWIPRPLNDRLQLQAYSSLHGKVPPRGLTVIVGSALELYFDVLDGKKVIQNVLP